MTIEFKLIKNYAIIFMTTTLFCGRRQISIESAIENCRPKLSEYKYAIFKNVNLFPILSSLVWLSLTVFSTVYIINYSSIENSCKRICSKCYFAAVSLSFCGIWIFFHFIVAYYIQFEAWIEKIHEGGEERASVQKKGLDKSKRNNRKSTWQLLVI